MGIVPANALLARNRRSFRAVGKPHLILLSPIPRHGPGRTPTVAQHACKVDDTLHTISPTIDCILHRPRLSYTLTIRGLSQRIFPDGYHISISSNQNLPAPIVPQVEGCTLLRPDATPTCNNALAIVHRAQIAPLSNVDKYGCFIHHIE